MAQAKGFDTSPKPGMLRGMQNQKWTVDGALAELVDNSFGAGRGNANLVEITYNIRRQTITVFDDGQGMEAVGRLFQLGNTIGTTAKDIGFYGSGGTMALLYLANKVTVTTVKGGRVSCDTVDWASAIDRDAFPVVADTWVRSTSANTPERLRAARHGTLIELQLRKERHVTQGNVMQRLAQTYAPGLRVGKQIIWETIGKGGERIELTDPLVLPVDPTRTFEFDLVVTHGDRLLPVYGKIGRVEELSHELSRVSIAYGSRVITRTRDCFSSPDGKEKYVGTGIAGWLDLGEEWRPLLTTTKDELNDRPAWDALMAHVFAQIRPLLQEMDEEGLTAEFDDLSAFLAEALDGKSRIDVQVAPTVHPIVDRRPPEPRETPVQPALPTGETEPEVPPPAPVPEADRRPAVAKVQIVRLDDTEMDGQLCKAELRQGDLMLVLVNKDHEAVQRALEAQPINRLALHLMITRAVADELVGRPSVIERVFPPRDAARLDAIEGDDIRVRAIQRLLMDRIVKGGKTAA